MLCKYCSSPHVHSLQMSMPPPSSLLINPVYPGSHIRLLPILVRHLLNFIITVTMCACAKFIASANCHLEKILQQLEHLSLFTLCKLSAIILQNSEKYRISVDIFSPSTETIETRISQLHPRQTIVLDINLTHEGRYDIRGLVYPC